MTNQLASGVKRVLLGSQKRGGLKSARTKRRRAEALARKSAKEKSK
jgi:hypothetical protein